MGLKIISKLSTGRFIRRICKLNNGYMVCGDKLTFLNNDLTYLHTEDVNIIDRNSVLFASNSTVYAMEDTMSAIIESNRITAVCCSFNIVAVGHEGGLLRLFENRVEVLKLQIHCDDITSLNMSGDMLISSSTDGTVNIMNIFELLQLQGMDEDTVDEYLVTLTTCNVEVSVNMARTFNNYIFVVTDMNQFSIWNVEGEKCIDFGFIQNYGINEWKCQSIVELVDEKIYCCMEYQEKYTLGIFEINKNSLTCTELVDLNLQDIVRAISVDSNEIICCSEDGVIIKMVI
eukprot:NODE_355_length_10246_cov_0.288263.p4 type:complete len:288 gc:universal NODE_355_length_10246_cov_0.288263:2604-1741(-)